jgi:hypothetical protein
VSRFQNDTVRDVIVRIFRKRVKKTQKKAAIGCARPCAATRGALVQETLGWGHARPRSAALERSPGHSQATGRVCACIQGRCLQHRRGGRRQACRRWSFADTHCPCHGLPAQRPDGLHRLLIYQFPNTGHQVDIAPPRHVGLLVHRWGARQRVCMVLLSLFSVNELRGSREDTAPGVARRPIPVNGVLDAPARVMGKWP